MAIKFVKIIPGCPLIPFRYAYNFKVKILFFASHEMPENFKFIIKMSGSES